MQNRIWLYHNQYFINHENTISQALKKDHLNAIPQSIKFPEDSVLRSIEKSSFSGSSIISLFIPSSVEELKEGWCKKTNHLNNITISPNNQHFKYLDNNHQIIVKKSDTNTNNYDVIVFASRNIEYVTIPNSIKCIESNSFENCKHLRTIEISEDSELQKQYIIAMILGQALKSCGNPWNPEKRGVLKKSFHQKVRHLLFFIFRNLL